MFLTGSVLCSHKHIIVVYSVLSTNAIKINVLKKKIKKSWSSFLCDIFSFYYNRVLNCLFIGKDYVYKNLFDKKRSAKRYEEFGGMYISKVEVKEKNLFLSRA